ncbi:VOC family protein [Thalassotalea sp. HSM 43]|uniref:VOC family protein n=1 Tax=Thalassotalea sp. HSM 43 TaxID=2552945 RepID=UPI001081E71C|nr:VOC family protein [Thalassotalea sp. HSM 43]QBY03280.1 VOC family protein [Thalassotalea sp. HSM 43]
MAIALTHIALHVKDLDACVHFYQQYAGLNIVRDRRPNGPDGKRIVWLAETGKEQQFIIVILPGGPGRNQIDTDFSHLGFALASKQAVDDIAAKAHAHGILAWPCKQEPYPVGYYCGIKDPDGNFVEFSYGQPLGPGAEKLIPEHQNID